MKKFSLSLAFLCLLGLASASVRGNSLSVLSDGAKLCYTDSA
ncbi:hypothetical protein [Deinococcus wulumuqiensis]|nr:hypothetical protein [Deinococcus wulumuqiensis]